MEKKWFSMNGRIRTVVFLSQEHVLACETDTCSGYYAGCWLDYLFIFMF